jgi:hypothetical protein
LPFALGLAGAGFFSTFSSLINEYISITCG